MTLTLAAVVEFGRTDGQLHAVIVADPEVDGDAYPTGDSLDDIWVRRIPVQVTIEDLS